MAGEGHKTFATPTAVLTMGLMGGRMTGIYTITGFVFILLPKHINRKVVGTILVAPPVALYLRCSIEVILSALLVLMLREIIISLLPEIDDATVWCPHGELLILRCREIYFSIIIPPIFQEVLIDPFIIAHLILIMCIYL